jgi:8-oxo-dGTP diphosphatase
VGDRIMSDTILLQTKWITVRQTPGGFQFAERRGRDSVAIFLVRQTATNGAYEVLIRQQPLCIDAMTPGEDLHLHPCPITGGIDGTETPEQSAVREVHEEAGYTVEVVPLGRYIVGTQTNEICYLYYADVTGQVPAEALQDGSYFEAISMNEWHPFSYLQHCDYAACQIGYYRLREILGDR